MDKNLFVGLLILVVLISGCTSSQPAATPVPTLPKQTTPPPPMTETVQIDDFNYFPPEVVIAKGGTVTWRNKQFEAHTVTGNGFDSGQLREGQTYSHTFNEPGTYVYGCKNHPSMSGKIVVK